jgi:hypothetical protein
MEPELQPKKKLKSQLSPEKQHRPKDSHHPNSKMRISKAYLYTTYPTEELQAIIAHLFRKIPLSQTSKSQYSIKIPQWLTYLPAPRTLHQLLTDPTNSLKHLQDTPSIKHSPANHHIYISSAVAFIKYILKDEALLKLWKTIERTNWTPIAEHYDENKPTELQSNKVITFEEVDAVRRSLERGTFERLLLSFYTLIEPIRADYYETEILESDSDTPTTDNYIVLKPTPRIVIKDFKTKQKYEKIENTVPSELYEELQASLEKYPRKYLFVMDDKQSPFTRKLFSNWACRTLTRVLRQSTDGTKSREAGMTPHPMDGSKPREAGMTLTVLRHIYITNKIQKNTPTKELVEIARRMGHSRDIQRIYEWG